jgi:adenine/guanine phosphoribosyltransferase-like PRPP-binding protein
MVNLTTKSRAEVAGIYALVAIGKRWREQVRDITDFPIEVVLTIKSRQ